MATSGNLSNQRSARRAKEMAAFGEALGSAMRARGMSQVELAAKLNVTQSMVSVWRNAQYECPHEIVFEMERILSLSPGTLSIRAGYLPPEAVQGATPNVQDAVLADELLSERARDTMLVLYDHLVTSEATPPKLKPKARTRTAKSAPSRNGRTKARSRTS